MASAGDFLRALGDQREVDHHDRILFDDADQQQDADERDKVRSDSWSRLQVTRRRPTPADGNAERMVIG